MRASTSANSDTAASAERPNARLRLSRRSDNRLEAFPTGWFVVCFSDELKPGGILERTFMGQDLVVFRTASGEACVSDAFCPHMGAHFAHGGTVEGDELRCPFHGFCFDSKGNCTRTGYGTRPPKKAKLRMWHTKEINGIVLVWHHVDFRAPEWDVPAIDDAGWSRLVHHEWQIQANPYDTAENSVDIGHFSIVHGYAEVGGLSPLKLDGPLLEAAYSIERDGKAFGQKGRIKSNFSITKWGLGYSCVDVSVPQFGMTSRHFVFPTAMTEDMLSMKIAVSVNRIDKPEAINPALRLLPQRALRRLILEASMIAYRKDVSQDFEIWKNKTRIDRPALADGDGPIAAFRRWTAQFAPEVSAE